MQAPINWIKEYIDIEETPERIAELFTMAGLEVSEITPERFGFGESCVARATRVERHPERPEMFVLTTEGGEHTNTVLTNLREFPVGAILPIARQGFVFPDGSVLEPRKMGGVVSDGKIISEADMEYTADANAILPVPDGAMPGDIVPDALGITDYVLKFDLTANRGDCLNIFGICRELSAILDRPLKKSPFDFTLETSPRDMEFSVSIKDKKLCPRYSGRLLCGVKVERSPAWMRRRLIASGMRPINCIVDVTNYVLLETGQPLHAFDLDTLEDGAIVVRRAKNGETIATLDGAERQLTGDMLVIADRKKPVAVAGVMGGAPTEITDKTRNMLLESAHFDPRSVRRASLALGLRTEASLRFEKGVDPERAAYASDYAAHLIQKNGWGVAQDGMIDSYPVKSKRRSISVAYKQIREYIGDGALDNERIIHILRNLGFVVIAGKSSIKIDVPSHRFDISIWQDIVEEVARIYGYNNVRSSLPRMELRRAAPEPNFAFTRSLKNMLAASGLTECVSFSFTNARELELARMGGAPAVAMKNPLTEDHTHLRPSLLPCMMRAVAMNIRRGNKDLSLFELGKIFLVPEAQSDAPRERMSLSIAVAGNPWRTPARSALDVKVQQYYQLKGVLEDFLSRANAPEPAFGPSTLPLFHPNHSASVFIEGVKFGEIGEVHPQAMRELGVRGEIAAAELDPEVLRRYAQRVTTYNRISNQPALTRDLSIIVSEETPAAAIREKMLADGGEFLRGVSLVDVFRGEAVGGEGKKSVTFTLEFRHPERTLGDAEVNDRIAAMLDGIKTSLGGVLRVG